MATFTTGKAATLIAETSDLSLIIDKDGTIQDVALGSDDANLKPVLEWKGKPWIDTVTVESRQTIQMLLADAAGASRWHRVNHPLGSDADLQILYKTIPYGDGQRVIAAGRDLRPMLELQQRLLDARYSLEQDCVRLQQAETSYGMLFNMASESILIVDADSRKIVDANPAAGKLFDKPAKKMINRAFPLGFSDNSNDAIESLLLRVRAAGRAESIVVTSVDNRHRHRLTASLIRRESGPSFLICITQPGANGAESMDHRMLAVVARSPDAIIIGDADGNILAANSAFLDLCQAAAELRVIGQPLDQWLGRPGIDVNLLMRNLRERGQVRQFSTTLKPEYGSTVPVELSAVSALDSDEPCVGFVIRPQIHSARIGKYGYEGALPSSLENLTELVGQVPLKDLVGQATGIIERICIEAALKMTGDSRASAAEMLGLSRQSLYVKLRRYGLGARQGKAETADDRSTE